MSQDNVKAYAAKHAAKIEEALGVAVNNALKKAVTSEAEPLTLLAAEMAKLAAPFMAPFMAPGLSSPSDAESSLGPRTRLEDCTRDPRETKCDGGGGTLLQGVLRVCTLPCYPSLPEGCGYTHQAGSL